MEIHMCACTCVCSCTCVQMYVHVCINIAQAITGWPVSTNVVWPHTNSIPVIPPASIGLENEHSLPSNSDFSNHGHIRINFKNTSDVTYVLIFTMF